jgi:hypothetical protein
MVLWYMNWMEQEELCCDVTEVRSLRLPEGIRGTHGRLLKLVQSAFQSERKEHIPNMRPERG